MQLHVMFRLLVILLVVNSLSKVDGAPTIKEESGNDVAVKKNRLDVVLGDGHTARNNALALTEEKLLPRVEKDMTPEIETSLKPRTLDDPEPGNKTSNWGQRMARKARSAKEAIASKASNCCKASDSHDSRTSKRPAGRTGGKKEANREKSSSPSKELYDSTEIHIKKEYSLVFVKAAGILLINPFADPYYDSRLSRIIDNAFHLYYDAFSRPFPNFDISDEKYQLSVKLAALAQILKDMKASKESLRASELASANYQLPSSFPKPSGPSPGINGDSAKDRAERVVNSVRFLLSQPGADPEKNNLAILIDAALREYGQAYDLPQLTSVVEEKGSTMDDKVAELKKIFKEIDALNQGTKDAISRLVVPTKQSSYPLESGLEEFQVLRELADADVAVNAARVALEDTVVDPFKDDEMAKKIDVAIEKYNKAHGHPRLRFRETDITSRMNRKLEEIYRIIDAVNARNEALEKSVYLGKVEARKRLNNQN